MISEVVVYYASLFAIAHDPGGTRTQQVKLVIVILIFGK